MMDKDGKEQEKNFQLAKDAKYLDSAGKAAKLDAFHPGDDVCLTQKDDKVTEMRKHAEATITKVDAKARTITVAMTDKDGKEVEKTFQLMEDAEYLDSTGRVSAPPVIKPARWAGDSGMPVRAKLHFLRSLYPRLAMAAD